MDNQEYLNQISRKPEGGKPGQIGSGLLSQKIIWIIVGAIGLFVIIAFVGIILSANKGNAKEDTIWLQLHLKSTAEVIDEYQPKVKSSSLRSTSASFSTVIASAHGKLAVYLEEKYGSKADSDKKLAEQIKVEQDALTQELFEAKITGMLDRIYAHKMAYEISKFMSEENTIRDETNDDNLKAILDESYGSLEKLYDTFNNFSEGS